MKLEKDRESTEKRLLETVGLIIEENGLEFLGVNQVAQRAGVSKMLIYRYFGSLEELIARYIMQYDYWVNLPAEIPDKKELNGFIKNLFREQIRQLRENKLLIRLCRWELSVNNSLVEEIRKKREENGVRLIDFVSRISGIPYSQIQILATLISSSITYLAMFGDVAEVYNGFPIHKEEGWKQLEEGINAIIDEWLVE
ncbi:MAG: TetR/AcrR family transcriptional regulator [Candidatus Azobacteroides sp.]|nr:TetR/AcrR family transcriptional regulator [Candidatus Azobacteroides sp.]